MSKSILVIRTPKACINCPCHHRDDAMVYDKEWCYVEMKVLKESEINISKPDWCPLKDIPEKKNLEELEGRPLLEAQWAGWNQCVDEIMKEV